MRVSRGNLLIFSYCIALTANVLQQTSIIETFSGLDNMINFMKITSVLIACLLEISHIRINYKSFKVIAMFTVLVLGNIFLNEGNIDLFYIVFFMYVCRDSEPQKILKCYAYVVGGILITTLVLYFLNILPDYVIRRNHSLGFVYSSFGPNMFLHACLAYVGSKNNNQKIEKWKWICILSFNLWLFIMTDTLSVFIFILVLLGVYCLFNKIQIENIIMNNSIFSRICIYCSYWSAMFIIIMQVLYNIFYKTTFWSLINSFLSQRLKMGREAFLRFSVTLFGQPILWTTGIGTSNINDYFYVDSSYLQILLRYGIVVLIVLCWFMVLISKYSYLNKKKYMLLSVTIFLLHCIFDPQLLSFKYNPFLICVLYVNNWNTVERKIKLS